MNHIILYGAKSMMTFFTVPGQCIYCPINFLAPCCPFCQEIYFYPIRKDALTILDIWSDMWNIGFMDIGHFHISNGMEQNIKYLEHEHYTDSQHIIL